MSCISESYNLRIEDEIMKLYGAHTRYFVTAQQVFHLPFQKMIQSPDQPNKELSVFQCLQNRKVSAHRSSSWEETGDCCKLFFTCFTFIHSSSINCIFLFIFISSHSPIFRARSTVWCNNGDAFGVRVVQDMLGEGRHGFLRSQLSCIEILVWRILFLYAIFSLIYDASSFLKRRLVSKIEPEWSMMIF